MQTRPEGFSQLSQGRVEAGCWRSGPGPGPGAAPASSLVCRHRSLGVDCHLQSMGSGCPALGRCLQPSWSLARRAKEGQLQTSALPGKPVFTHYYAPKNWGAYGTLLGSHKFGDSRAGWPSSYLVGQQDDQMIRSPPGDHMALPRLNWRLSQGSRACPGSPFSPTIKPPRSGGLTEHFRGVTGSPIAAPADPPAIW